MNQIKCPHCGEMFTVDESGYAAIVKQVRDNEFNKDIHTRLNELQQSLTVQHQAELKSQESQIKLQTKESYDKEIEALKLQLQRERENAKELEMKLNSSEQDKKLAVIQAERRVEEEKRKVEEEKRNLESDIINQENKYKILLDEKDKEVQLYKDLKTRMSTKMVGETLEQHCLNEFNRIRMTAFPNAYFEKDNDQRTGSKGDFIYRECDANGVELISIMFEMKNEMETTATKHKNEHFFKELDKDRREKNCEYAVLVSLLEADSDYYNAGIVDVSYEYEKMYVVRPQCFIPIITLLRNAALNSLKYKQELAEVKNQHIDITNFESSLMDFKNDFSYNFNQAHKRFEEAIKGIDDTMSKLQKIREALTKSDDQLRRANNKVDGITIKKLTKGNPTMAEKFEELKNN
ncbi:MAG: DUF2130 domain-containing protein [Eubacterium sp.]